MRKTLIPALLFAGLIAAGCGGKADPAKITEGTQLIEKGDYEKGLAILDQLGKETPGDDAVKVARINGHLKYGKYLEYESSLPPREKYPSALRQYRVVLSLDANNTDAKNEASLIESIYNQMGRPIPQ